MTLSPHIRARTGFDQGRVLNELMPRMVVGLVKTTDRTSTADTDTDSMPSMAMSVADADAILAKYGFKEREVEMAV